MRFMKKVACICVGAIALTGCSSSGESTDQSSDTLVIYSPNILQIQKV